MGTFSLSEAYGDADTGKKPSKSFSRAEAEANERLKSEGSIMAEYPQFLGGAYQNAPGVAGVAASGINALGNIARLLPSTDLLPAIQQFKDWSDEELAAYRSQFGKDPYAALGNTSANMLLGLTAAKKPVPSYTGQIAQGAGAGYLVGGLPGAAMGAGGAAVLGVPQAGMNAVRRSVATDDLGDLLNPFNRQVRLDIPPAAMTSPEYQQALLAQQRLGAPLSIGQKTGSLRTLSKEKSAMGASGQLDKARDFTNRQAQALDLEAQTAMNRASPPTTAAAVGEGIEQTSKARLRTLVGQRKAAWDAEMAGVNKNLPDIDLTAYENALAKVIDENNLNITTPMMRQVAKAARSRLEQIYTPAKQQPTGLLDAQGRPITRTIPEKHLKGTVNEVQAQLRDAGEAAYAGPSPFGTVKAAAETRVDRIMKESLDDVLQQNPNSMGAASLKRARDAFAQKSKEIDAFESSELGRLLEASTKEGKQLAPEQAVRALIKNKNPSEILAAKAVLQQSNPSLWSAIERQYMEMLVGAGRTRPLAGYHNFGPGQLLSRKPVRGDLNAPAETSREVMEAILSPAQLRAMDTLYADAARLALHTPPVPQAGSRDMSRISQELGVAGGAASGNVRGASPFIAKLFTEPMSGPRLRMLTSPETEAALLNPEISTLYGRLGALAYPLIEAYQRGLLNQEPQ